LEKAAVGKRNCICNYDREDLGKRPLVKDIRVEERNVYSEYDV
jgi:hypothetical protein